jgi:hypothetical protein
MIRIDLFPDKCHFTRAPHAIQKPSESFVGHFLALLREKFSANGGNPAASLSRERKPHAGTTRRKIVKDRNF